MRPRFAHLLSVLSVANPFVPSQVSGWDYLHPSRSGQTVLASITYAAGYGW